MYPVAAADYLQPNLPQGPLTGALRLFRRTRNDEAKEQVHQIYCQGDQADNGQSWNEITAGHLVIAQESAKEGWWEVIVIDRKADSLTLQFRDYPNLPKFVRHRSGIALMSPPADEAKPAAQSPQA